MSKPFAEYHARALAPLKSERFCCDGRCNENQGRGGCPRFVEAKQGLLRRAGSCVLDVLVAIGAALLLGALGIYPKDGGDK